jgi:hypothetical protein
MKYPLTGTMTFTVSMSNRLNGFLKKWELFPQVNSTCHQSKARSKFLNIVDAILRGGSKLLHLLIPDPNLDAIVMSILSNLELEWN